MFPGAQGIVMQDHCPGGAPKKGRRRRVFHGDKLDGRAPVAADNHGAFLTLNLFDETQALGFELRDGDLHK